MKIAVGILTFNMFNTGRAHDFQRTLASIQAADVPYVVVTNGSTDGTQDVVRDLGGIVDDTDSRIFYGITKAVDWCVAQGADVVLFTADDIEYRAGWAEKLAAFWQDAPADIVLASLLAEPAYAWNAISGTDEAGGVHYITRTSVGSCSWSFRATDYSKIFPLPAIMPGEDLAACNRIIANGLRIAAMNLGDHIGEKHSAWGNQSWLYAQPLPDDVMEWLEVK